MQTFLAYALFLEALKCLDNKRLGKQRSENKYKTQAWQVFHHYTHHHHRKHHPAVLMWRGYLDALISYYNACLDEWQSRGFNNSMEKLPLSSTTVVLPWWLGLEAFHTSHRSNLLRKDRRYYSSYGWSESSELPYIWPVSWSRELARPVPNPYLMSMLDDDKRAEVMQMYEIKKEIETDEIKKEIDDKEEVTARVKRRRRR